jgi:hypothetical protein
MKETEVITFLVPRAHKKALRMVAADMETTPSDLLRIAVDRLINRYRDGFFIEDSARDSVQSLSEEMQEVVR